MKFNFSFWVLFLGITLVSKPAQACNACGCNFTNIQPDMQLKKAKYSLSLVQTNRWLDYQAGKNKSLSDYNYPSIIQQIQGGQTGHSHILDDSYYQEYRNDVELRANIFFHDKMSVGLILPFRQVKLFRDGSEIDNIKGMGDPVLFLNYHPLDLTGIKQRGKLGHRLTIGTGAELPFGKFSIRGYENEIVPAYQPSSGSFDFLFLGNYMLTFKKFGWFNYYAYKLNTKNPNGFEFSNTMNFKSNLFLSLAYKKSQFIPQMGMELQQTGADELNNEKFEKDSGGYLMLASFGLEYFYNNYGLNVKYSIPFVQNLHGEQFDYKHLFEVGIRFLINKKNTQNEINK